MQDSNTMKINYSKKLDYLIRKIYLSMRKNLYANFDDSFIAIIKELLKRGSNYFRHDQILFIKSILERNLHERLIHYLKD